MMNNKKSNTEFAVDFMKKDPGCTIVGSLNPKGHRIYRLRDGKVHPIINLTPAEFKSLLDNDTLIKKDDGIWVLNN